MLMLIHLPTGKRCRARFCGYSAETRKACGITRGLALTEEEEREVEDGPKPVELILGEVRVLDEPEDSRLAQCGLRPYKRIKHASNRKTYLVRILDQVQH